MPAGLKNRMGGSIGGPIIKNKFFFFGNYEGQRQKVGTSATNTLPTSLATETCLGNSKDTQGGNGCDFSEYLSMVDAKGNKTAIIYDQTKLDGSGNPTPFPNNIIPRSYLGAASAPALALLKVLEPYTKGITTFDSNYHGSGTGLFNSNQWTVRGDYTVNDKAHAFARFSRFWDTLSGKVMFGDAGGPGYGIGNYGGNSNGANDSLASGMDIAVSPKTLTDFRLAYYRYNVIDTKFDQGVEYANTLGIPGINTGSSFTSGSPGFQFANVPGGSGGTQTYPAYGTGLGISRCNCPLTEREDQFQIVNNWTRIEGNHSIKIGADLRYGRNLRVPSDTDRAGLLHFDNGPTENPAASTQGGLGFATFMLGQVNQFGRFVSTSTNAKEFQKRTFFYAQDTWRATRNLTLNLGVRWELYFPETVNANGNGALLNISDGYLHVAGIGGIGSNMGWEISKKKMFAPRIGLTYQLDPKTVVRAGYGRSFDTGVFGSIFGHTVTQNLPVLGNQAINAPTTTGKAFDLNVGPATPVSVTVPSSGLLPNPGSQVTSSARANPLNFPTIDAWNLSVQRALTPSLTLTIAYVANKGTHTLSDGDGNNTNPNEAAINLPAQYSVNGQALHYDPSVPTADSGQIDPSTGKLATGISATNGTATTNFLQRYYGSSLAACKDANYSTPTNEPFVKPGMCGWTNSIAYRGGTQNTEFDALQVTLAQQFSKGLAITGNYEWASAFDEQSNYSTWDRKITHMRDSNVRDQTLVVYGSYDLPFGKGKQYYPGANRITDLIIGGYQLSGTMNWSGGLPFSLNYNECGTNVPSSVVPCDPSVVPGGHMKTNLTSFVAGSGGTGTRTFYEKHALGDGLFVNPGLDNPGNVGLNTYRGPHFFGTDLGLTKAFTIHENIVTKFRFDAFNAFNHINAANPSGNIENGGAISSLAVGGTPRQLEFSLRVQF